MQCLATPGSLLHHLNNLLVGLRHPNDVSSFTILVRAEVAPFSSRCLDCGVVLDGKVRASRLDSHWASRALGCQRLMLRSPCSYQPEVRSFLAPAVCPRSSPAPAVGLLFPLFLPSTTDFCRRLLGCSSSSHRCFAQLLSHVLRHTTMLDRFLLVRSSWTFASRPPWHSIAATMNFTTLRGKRVRSALVLSETVCGNHRSSEWWCVVQRSVLAKTLLLSSHHRCPGVRAAK